MNEYYSNYISTFSSPQFPINMGWIMSCPFFLSHIISATNSDINEMILFDFHNFLMAIREEA